MELSRLSPKILEYFLSVLKVDNKFNVHDYDELEEVNSYFTYLSNVRKQIPQYIKTLSDLCATMYFRSKNYTSRS